MDKPAILATLLYYCLQFPILSQGSSFLGLLFLLHLQQFNYSYLVLKLFMVKKMVALETILVPECLILLLHLASFLPESFNLTLSVLQLFFLSDFVLYELYNEGIDLYVFLGGAYSSVGFLYILLADGLHEVECLEVEFFVAVDS